MPAKYSLKPDTAISLKRIIRAGIVSQSVIISFEVKSSWVDLLQLVLITVIGAYFGGRSLEKVKK